MYIFWTSEIFLIFTLWIISLRIVFVNISRKIEPAEIFLFWKIKFVYFHKKTASQGSRLILLVQVVNVGVGDGRVQGDIGDLDLRILEDLLEYV